jgi:hypothetical protein
MTGGEMRNREKKWTGEEKREKEREKEKEI